MRLGCSSIVEVTHSGELIHELGEGSFSRRVHIDGKTEFGQHLLGEGDWGGFSTLTRGGDKEDVEVWVLGFEAEGYPNLPLES